MVNVDASRVNSSVIIDHLEEAAALDFYYAEETIFWTDIGLEMIKGSYSNQFQSIYIDFFFKSRS